MSVNKNNIKKAIDNFENDSFIDTEEILKKEIKNAKNEFLKKELELENEIELEDYSENKTIDDETEENE